MCRYRWPVKNDSVSEHDSVQPFHLDPCMAVLERPKRSRFRPETAEDPGSSLIAQGLSMSLEYPCFFFSVKATCKCSITPRRSLMLYVYRHPGTAQCTVAFGATFMSCAWWCS